MHLDAPFPFVINRYVSEVADGEVRTQLAVDSREQVQVEGRRDAELVVVRGFEHGALLLQVRAEQQRVARAQHPPNLLKKLARALAVEVPHVRAEEEHERPLALVQLVLEQR